LANGQRPARRGRLGVAGDTAPHWQRATSKLGGNTVTTLRLILVWARRRRPGILGLGSGQALAGLRGGCGKAGPSPGPAGASEFRLGIRPRPDALGAACGAAWHRAAAVP
jgi:hypothetical protein